MGKTSGTAGPGTAGKRPGLLLAALVTMLVSCLLAGALSAVAPQEASAATVSDNFTRANGGLGSNWTTVTGTSAPAIVSNTVRPGTASKLNSAYWSASTFGNDQFAQASLPASSGTSYGPGIAVRLSSSKGYILWYGNSPGTVSLWRMDSATSWTQLKQSAALTVTPSSDVWKIQAVGSTISGYQNGKLVVQVTDTKITSGSPGVWLYYAPDQISNWSGGDVSAPSTYSVGGAVSGLSGTVVLQDNGAGDLTVSAAGPFTFGTGLAAGAAYSVTVKTNPAGQTCSVASGTGTVGSANVTNVAVTCSSSVSGTATDDFNRANGPLGPNWASMSDGGLVISSQAVTGTAGAYSGDIRTAETYTSDQYSQVEVTSTQISGGQWIGPAVRAQNGGLSLYLGIYFWNSGNPELMLFKRSGGNWTQLGSSYFSGALPAGTQLKISAVGSTISFLQNGVQRITATDASLTGGAPGIMAFQTPTADNWAGGSLSAAGTYSVGGNISGLSGTAVLEDNGGDDLSVSASGPFTFGTLLPNGGAYNVTVKNGPAGQNCTVANGSGTISSASVSNVAVTCTANSAGSGSDNFNRADGPLGANWTDMSDGGLAVSSQTVAGTSATGTTGGMRTAESYSSNQYSQVEVTSAQLTGSQWIGPAVRTQNGGQNGYVGVYTWNNGSPELLLYLRSGGSWNQIGNAYSSGPLPAGTQLKLMAVGSTLSFLENGVERIAVYDNSWTGGAPGIMAFGTATADNWSGGSAGFEAHYLSTDANGVQSYDMISASNGDGPQILRVLRPSNPAAGVAHNFLFVLPVEAGQGTTFGDGMATLETANAQNQYNLTIIEPSFAIEPWYADNPNDANLQYETFMTSELAPWVKANLATSGTEQNWLIGFSKSGIGGQDLLLKHPDVFTLAASWDFPADMSAYDEYGSSSASSYGTDANFQASYRLTPAFLTAHKAPFVSNDRIWIGGYNAFQTDMTDYNSLLTAEGIAHSTETWTVMPHRWDSGWVPLALAALEQESVNQH